MVTVTPCAFLSFSGSLLPSLSAAGEVCPVGARSCTGAFEHAPSHRTPARPWPRTPRWWTRGTSNWEAEVSLTKIAIKGSLKADDQAHPGTASVGGDRRAERMVSYRSMSNVFLLFASNQALSEGNEQSNTTFQQGKPGSAEKTRFLGPAIVLHVP